MTSLHELQSAFIEGVLHERPQRACGLIATNGLAPERRISIYRNNARENFLKTLEAAFPVVARLSGEAWFRQTGLAYMRAHPSRSGDLHHVGEHFAAFLRRELAGGAYDYFADVADLEWAYQEVLVAADHPAFEIADLQRVAPEEYEALTFTVHPALRLVASTYPVLAIWKAHQPSASEADALISLDAGASRVLVLRREDHVELRELDAAQFELLQAFARGATFAAAAEAVFAVDASADLSALLGWLFQLRVFVDFSLKHDSASTEAHAQRSDGSPRSRG